MFLNIDSIIDNDEGSTVTFDQRSLKEEVLCDQDTLDKSVFSKVEMSESDFTGERPMGKPPKFIFVNKKTYERNPDIVADMAPIVAVCSIDILDGYSTYVAHMTVQAKTTLKAMFLDNHIVFPMYVRETWKLGIYSIGQVANNFYYDMKCGTLCSRDFYVINVFVLGRQHFMKNNYPSLSVILNGDNGLYREYNQLQRTMDSFSREEAYAY